MLKNILYYFFISLIIIISDSLLYVMIYQIFKFIYFINDWNFFKVIYNLLTYSFGLYVLFLVWLLFYKIKSSFIYENDLLRDIFDFFILDDKDSYEVQNCNDRVQEIHHIHHIIVVDNSNINNEIIDVEEIK